MIEMSLSAEMIEAVFREWEAAHPGQNICASMTPDQFTDLLMAKVMASVRSLPEGSAISAEKRETWLREFMNKERKHATE